MSHIQSILVASVRNTTRVMECAGDTIRYGFSDSELYIRDVRRAAFFQKECRKHCYFPSGEINAFFPSDDHTYLEARLPVVVCDGFFADELGRVESTASLISSIEAFESLCRLAAAILAEVPMDYDLNKFDQARSLATRIQNEFELTQGHTFVVFFGDDRDPVDFRISPKSVSELSPVVIEISGVVTNYLSETQVHSGFWVESTGKKITVEGVMDHSNLFKDALKTGEIIQLSIRPFGNSDKYTKASIVTAVRTGRFSRLFV